MVHSSSEFYQWLSVVPAVINGYNAVVLNGSQCLQVVLNGFQC